MATYYVWSGAGGTNSGLSWANAYTAFGSAVTQATGGADIILVHYTHQEELAADTTYTFNSTLISVFSVDKDSSDAPTPMGTGGWIGNSTTNRSVTLAGADCAIYFYGITFRTAGSTTDVISAANSAGSDHTFESCYFWNGNSSTSGTINLVGAITATARYIGCTFRFGATAQRLNFSGNCTLEGCTLSSDGSTPTTLLQFNGSGMIVRFVGCDLSLVTGTLVPNQGSQVKVEFAQCKLGSGVTMLASQTTNPTGASAEVFVYDCSSGDEHYQFGHHSYWGSTTIDTSIYANDGAEYNLAGTKHSWKIVGIAGSIATSPYRSPWISVHHEGTSAITPNLEAVRSGSATKYNENEVWTEWLYKGTSGSTRSTLDRSDAGGIISAGAAQATGALDASGWTGENATSAFMKLAPSSAITPAEIGDLCVRVCVAGSNTVYVDPQIRGRS